MKTIIRARNDFLKNANQTIVNKKMIFYDNHSNLLIYKNGANFYFPKVLTSSDSVFLDGVKKITNIDFNNDKVQQIMEIIESEIRFNTTNGKMKKEYLKFVRDYYCCALSFEESKNQIFKENNFGLPKIIKINDAIDVLKGEKNHCSNTLQSVYELKKKIGG